MIFHPHRNAPKMARRNPHYVAQFPACPTPTELARQHEQQMYGRTSGGWQIGRPRPELREGYRERAPRVPMAPMVRETTETVMVTLGVGAVGLMVLIASFGGFSA